MGNVFSESTPIPMTPMIADDSFVVASPSLDHLKSAINRQQVEASVKI